MKQVKKKVLRSLPLLYLHKCEDHLSDKIVKIKTRTLIVDKTNQFNSKPGTMYRFFFGSNKPSYIAACGGRNDKRYCKLQKYALLPSGKNRNRFSNFSLKSFYE